MKKTILILTAMTSFYSHSAVAAECDEKSPTLIAQGDKYYDISEVPGLTAEQQRAVKKLFSSVKRKLKGSGSTAVCVAENGVQVKQVTAEKYSAGFAVQADGAVRLSIDAEKQQDKTTYNEIFELFGFDNIFVIKQISAGSMTIYSKQRRSTGNQTILNEEIITISVSNRTLNIESTRYINGYFAREYNRTFR